MPRHPRTLVVAALALVSLVTVAAAATVVGHTGAGDGSEPPSARWAAGPDAADDARTSGWTLSSNATFFSVTLEPGAGTDTTWSHLAILRSSGTAAVEGVVIRGTSLAGAPHVGLARAELYRENAPDVLVGTLDLAAASPALELAALQADERYLVKLSLRTAPQQPAGGITVSFDVM